MNNSPQSSIQQHPASIEGVDITEARKIVSYRCKKGHPPVRYRSDGWCVVCAREKLRNRYKNNPEKERKRRAKYVAENGDAVRERNRASQRKRRILNPGQVRVWEKRAYAKKMADPIKREKELARCRDKAARAYARDPEKFRDRSKVYRSDPSVAERDRQRCKKYKRENPEVIQRLNLKHNHVSRAAKLQRTPPWLTDEHKKEMTAIYRKSRAAGMHVDHIVPLRGEMVSGLHVPWNLRIVTPQENLSKGNKFGDKS